MSLQFWLIRPLEEPPEETMSRYVETPLLLFGPIRIKNDRFLRGLCIAIVFSDGTYEKFPAWINPDPVFEAVDHDGPFVVV
jgi:hypothetical protein